MEPGAGRYEDGSATDPPYFAPPTTPAAVAGALAGATRCQLGGARTSAPLTVTATGARGEAAGPCATEPSATLNLLPWQEQSMVPSVTLATMQPAWVQTAEKPLNSPFTGWVTMILASG